METFFQLAALGLTVFVGLRTILILAVRKGNLLPNCNYGPYR